MRRGGTRCGVFFRRDVMTIALGAALGVVLWGCSASVARAEGPSKGDATAVGQVSKVMGKKIELPWVKGAFQHVMDPPGQKADPKKRTWYVNDHCFFIDKENTIHWFGITNPYPDKGGSLYGPGSHRFIGHATAKSPWGPWEERKPAFAQPEDTKECIGACFVVEHGGQFIMVYGYSSGYTTAQSNDLDEWEVIKEQQKIDLGPGTRDPCVVKQLDGKYFLYGATGFKGFSAVGLAQSDDMKKWHQEPPALESDFRGALLESPFVYRRGKAFYLFLNHSHRQYEETLVFRSEDPEHFDWKKPLCTIFAHAAEIFEWNGKTYISHCGIEDRHWKQPGLYLAELSWTNIEDMPKDTGNPNSENK